MNAWMGQYSKACTQKQGEQLPLILSMNTFIDEYELFPYMAAALRSGALAEGCWVPAGHEF